MRLGQVLYATVELKPGQRALESQLKEFVASKLAKFKIPQTIAIVEQLPRTGSGKIHYLLANAQWPA
jgi:acyl-coenzyme A synthetase/AMP-(fatty) acid ligase